MVMIVLQIKDIFLRILIKDLHEQQELIVNCVRSGCEYIVVMNL